MADLSLQTNPKLSGFGDLIIENGDLVLNSGAQAILQHILQRLRIFLGEWFMDVTIGLDYFNQILIANPDQSKIDALFINQICGTPGVDQLNSYSFSPDFTNRVLTVRFQVQTTSGIVNYSGLVNAA